MKKLTMLFAGMLFAGFSFAQTGNTSTTTQHGTSHYADVDQNGNDNGSEIIQDQGFNYNLANGSTAEVDQIGDDNTNYINSWGWNHEVYVWQEGDENASGVTQSGGQNDAYVSQFGDKNTVKGLGTSTKAYQKAGDPFGADKSFFDVDQIGDENTVEMWQEHSAYATVKQDGFKNSSTVKQTGPVEGADNEADIYIHGAENTSNLLQIGDGNKAGLWSTGDYNEYYMTQLGDMNSMRVESGGDFNDVIFYQDGYKNQAYINMRGTGPGTFGRTMTAHDSDDNEVYMSQTGTENLFSGFICGDENDLDVIQSGSYNKIGTGMWTADGVNILGDYNDVDVMQTGTSNSAFVNVTGDNNFSSTVQH